MTNSKTAIIVTGIIGLVVTAGLFLFVFQPLAKSVTGLAQGLAAKEAELQELEQQIVEFKSAQTDLASATFRDDIYASIVEREDLSLAITKLETAADENTVTESIQISDPVDEDGRRAARTDADPVFEGLNLATEVDYVLTLGGGFADVVGFMQELENLSYFTEFKVITLTAKTEPLPAGGGTRNTGQLAGTLDGVFLVKNQADEPQE